MRLLRRGSAGSTAAAAVRCVLLARLPLCLDVADRRRFWSRGSSALLELESELLELPDLNLTTLAPLKASLPPRLPRALLLLLRWPETKTLTRSVTGPAKTPLLLPTLLSPRLLLALLL